MSGFKMRVTKYVAHLSIATSSVVTSPVHKRLCPFLPSTCQSQMWIQVSRLLFFFFYSPKFVQSRRVSSTVQGRGANAVLPSLLSSYQQARHEHHREPGEPHVCGASASPSHRKCARPDFLSLTVTPPPCVSCAGVRGRGSGHIRLRFPSRHAFDHQQVWPALQVWHSPWVIAR